MKPFYITFIAVLTIMMAGNSMAVEEAKYTVSLKSEALEIRVSHDGRFIYCANRDLTQQGRDSLSVFVVAPQGQMTLIQTIHAKVRIPRNINLAPSGKWLLVAGLKSNNITAFKINIETGKLTFSGHKISIPKAMCIDFK